MRSSCGGLCCIGLGCCTMEELHMVTGGECGDIGSGLLPGEAVADVDGPRSEGWLKWYLAACGLCANTVAVVWCCWWAASVLRVE